VVNPPESNGAARPLSVLVLNSSAGTREILPAYLSARGIAVSTSDLTMIRQGVIDGGGLVAGLSPDVIVIDIAPPWEVNWQTYLDVQRNPLVRYPIVVTTTNERALSRLVGAAGLIELVGKPDDLGRVYEAIARAASLNLGAGVRRSDDRRTGERRRRERRRPRPTPVA
jgi:chemotaxis response regulator CheB